MCYLLTVQMIYLQPIPDKDGHGGNLIQRREKYKPVYLKQGPVSLSFLTTFLYYMNI